MEVGEWKCGYLFSTRWDYKKTKKTKKILDGCVRIVDVFLVPNIVPDCPLSAPCVSQDVPGADPSRQRLPAARALRLRPRPLPQALQVPLSPALPPAGQVGSQVSGQSALEHGRQRLAVRGQREGRGREIQRSHRYRLRQRHGRVWPCREREGRGREIIQRGHRCRLS